MSDFRLRVFEAVARHKSFTLASRELFISQPAISRHIRELEQEYRTPLFSRTSSRVELTRAGERLLEHASIILKCYRNMQSDMMSSFGDCSGELRLSASTSIAQYLLPELVARFVSRCPDVKMTVESGNSVEVEEHLRAGSIDLGLVESHARSRDLHYTPLINDELVLVVGTGGRCRSLEQVTLSQLTEMPIVLRETGSGTLDVISQHLAQCGLRLQDLNCVINLDSTEAIKQFVRHSDTCAIVSIMAVANELLAGTLKVVDVEGVSFERELAFVSLHGGVTDTARAFLDFALNYNLRLSAIKK